MSNAAKMQLSDFDIEVTISKGTFGTVYKAIHKGDGKVFALKQVNLKGMKRMDREESIDEARLLAQLNHPNIIRHYGSFIDQNECLNIVMEYAANGNLHALVRSYRGRSMPEELIWRVFLQALLGLAYIHSKKIIHRDMKSLNVFLDSLGNVKIGDLGIARALGEHSEFAHTIVGTPFYLSPELCEDKPYDEKSDVWALGVILYECCMGKYPFEAQNEGALIRKILRGSYPPVEGPYSSALTQVVAACLTFDPKRRPTTNQLLHNHHVVNKAKSLSINLSPSASPVVEETPAAAFRQGLHDPIAPQHGNHGALPASSPHKQGYGQVCAAPSQRHPFHLEGRDSPLSPQQQMAIAPARGEPQVHQMCSGQMGPGSSPGGKKLARGSSQDEEKQIRPLSATRSPSCPPYATPSAGGYEASNRVMVEAIWGHNYQAPQYGRRRCPDLMATSPAARGPSKTSGPPGRTGWAPQAPSDATSYCTSYARTSCYPK